MSAIRSHTLTGFVVLLLIVSLLEGCASLAYLPGQKTIGTLRTLGPNVHVNDAPAIDGQTITSGDHVTTGAGSSVYLYFLSGGFIQLDENTDPDFKLVWEQTKCFFIIVKHLIGQAYEETNPECKTIYKTAHGEWTHEGTQFNVLVDNRQSVMTVLDGKMELLSPQQMNQEQGQQMIVTKSGVQSVRKLSEQELRDVTRWRDRFPPPGLGGGGSRQAGECTD
jgi:hypothetical protein